MSIPIASKVVKARRDYNTWVATETLEDYALRFTPKSFRKWSELLVANTAIGGISFLALEAIGGSLAISYGFANSFWAIVIVSIIIFLAGLPICYYASEYNIDMDLLTRGAGFGYLGSTITSLIYASFTFIFFALEAAIMAQALELYFHLPLWLGYIICSLIIIPLVFFGVTLINQLQFWTQPIWLILMISPYVFILCKDPQALHQWVNFAGESPSGASFNPLLFGSAATVSFSLIAQIGEQVDYLRFLPDRQPENRRQWWIAAIAAGPGWIVLGAAKQLGGAFLAALAVSQGVSFAKAHEPIQMYIVGFESIFSNPAVVLGVATFFVIVSQIKINVTNAYAGSLAWSNFFSRLTHSHPGRVVWLVFNVAIALLLMELGVFATLDAVLGLYSNIAIAWVGALVADLVINKPLGFSPSYIEFKRAYLYNINPVGFGSMLVASAIAIAAFLGAFGSTAQAFSSFIALGVAFILSPVIAILTQGKYYIARENTHFHETSETAIACGICSNLYEPQDMAYCPIYDTAICSLCCSLDARCHDSCKPNPHHPWVAQLQTLYTQKISPHIGQRLLSFLLIFSSISGFIALVLWLFYTQQIAPVVEATAQVQLSFFQLYAVFLVLVAIASWWLVLSEESRQLAQEELDKQNGQLQQEIAERLAAETALQALTQELEARVIARTAELTQALHQLQQAQIHLVQSEKLATLGQLLAGVAHEINNPVSFIFGNLKYAEDYNTDLLNHLRLYQKHYPNPVPEISDHAEEIDLAYLIEDFPHMLSSMKVGIDRIAALSVSLRNFYRCDTTNKVACNIHEGLESTLLILQHRLKANQKRSAIQILKNYGDLSPVECYPGQLNQVFMNLLANAIDALEEERSPLDTQGFQPTISISTILEPNKAIIQIADNGSGMPPEVQARLFEPLFTTKPVGKGTGLGLSISQQIICEKHGGFLSCQSVLGEGTVFKIELPIC
ncbi:histidine kinase [Desertifilum sp. FACHB-1129]|uniref:histidine kinase n=2 Tax=Desertifilum tharense IPPAS B-1220 TaxID=1781255 RepID=A0A1E5QFD1_9CYAN|nr:MULTISPECIES: ATP-binding protein [Desertifilum]MDA0208948.1 ATP-binding protein [Cyanobacteria bacterium FC1]MBD2310431.1 histidine kinase [Desertifilum sp. FACHB-1129]MBD2321883.1 histidine kinase [Desertifilum sp. FACHB-866]MBD2332010.1 histidine kinase [Desertifilum sp. FACHB-868]OEJ73400.1 histidine kinase [Desertifilum tharense IPPAS B-1220]